MKQAAQPAYEWMITPFAKHIQHETAAGTDPDLYQRALPMTAEINTLHVKRNHSRLLESILKLWSQL